MKKKIIVCLIYFVLIAECYFWQNFLDNTFFNKHFVWSVVGINIVSVMFWLDDDDWWI